MRAYVLLFCFEDGDGYFHREFVDAFASVGSAKDRAQAENDAAVRGGGDAFPILGPEDNVPWNDKYESVFSMDYDTCWQIVIRELAN